MLRLSLYLCLATCWICSTQCQNSTSRFQSADNPVQTENIDGKETAAQLTYWGTNTTDLAAISSLNSSLSLSSEQQQELGWIPNTDPCGNETCGFLDCTWPGISCRSWHITGIDVSDQVLNKTHPLTGTLPRQLATLSHLESFNASGHELHGTLPPEWGSLSSLEFLDLSRNKLTGSLPVQWVNMSAIAIMNLSSNYLAGSVPPAWANLTSLFILDVNNNNLCYSSPLSSRVTLRNGAPIACSAQILAASVPTAAPPPVPPPPPANASPPNSAQTGQPVLQMSTGINIAVSVVIGAFLLFGVVAGAIRVRRQQHAYRTWQEASLEARQRQEREEEEAYQNMMKTRKPPVIVLDPSGDALVLGKELVQEGLARNEQEEAAGSTAEAGEPSTAAQSSSAQPAEDLLRTTDNLLNPEQAASSSATDNPLDVAASSSAAEAPVGAAAAHPSQDELRAAESTMSQAASSSQQEDPAPDSNRQQSIAVGGGQLLVPRRVLAPNAWEAPIQRPYQRKLPFYEMDLYINSAGAFEFARVRGMGTDSAPGGTHEAGPSPMTSLPQNEESALSPRRLPGILAGLMPGSRDSQAGPSAPPADVEVGPSSPEVPNTSAASQHHNEQVAARVRQRIDELREPRAEEVPSDDGPAPPPPIVRWPRLRRMLGMEDEEQRAARLREVEQARQISMVTREASRVGSIRSPSASAPSISRP